MRLCFAVIAFATALLATPSAVLASKQTHQKLILSDSFLESHTTTTSEHGIVQTRRLRISEEAREGNPGNPEERRLVNVDLAIQDGIHALRKMTKWKLQFSVWKALNRKPFDLGNKWGVIKNGWILKQHPKWEKYEAYRTYFGQGPLTYP
ncbi:Putative RxLR effector [Phytophthora palmivora]|uniref:RxLR effector protein n=1 Tax=Phytophthora palmivora TaxID=4796 RepID=A0A2P4WWV7_9STRA|nr:Putative RxLR effector [Phytophthora palmivora]